MYLFQLYLTLSKFIIVILAFQQQCELSKAVCQWFVQGHCAAWLNVNFNCLPYFNLKFLLTWDAAEFQQKQKPG